MEGQTCATCRFWQKVTTWCRRYPRPFGGTFPEMPDAAWCGEWASADPASFDATAKLLALSVLVTGDRTAARALADKLTGMDET